MNHRYLVCASCAVVFVPVFTVSGDQTPKNDWLPADAAGFRAIGDRIVIERDSLQLSEQQAAALAGRHAALLEVRTRQTAAEYLELMRSWGGVYRVEPTSMEFREGQVVDWHAPGTPCPWERVDISSFEAVTLVFAHGEPLLKGWPRLTKGAGPGVFAHGSFTFAGGTDMLVTSGVPVVQIQTRVATVDGSQMTFGIRWVWNAPEQAWLPWHVNQVAQSPGGVCALFY